MRAALLLTLCLHLLCGFALAEDDGAVWDRRKAKTAKDLATRWWKARPPTKFDTWDAAVQSALIEEAKALGDLPEGKLADVLKALWEPVKKYGPRHGRGGKATIKTPYGEAWFIANGSGRNKGLVIGLHGGGPGAGSASGATKWSAKNCIGFYPQGIRLVHDTWNTVHGERYILTLIEIAKAQYQVDPDRVFCMGFSMGGTGSFFMAARHPDLLAGALPGNGVIYATHTQVATREAVGAVQHGLLPNVRNVAIWYFTGHDDKNCEPGTFLYADHYFAEARKSDPDGYAKIRFKAYPGLAHSFPPGEPSAGIKFLSGQTRETFPKVIVWEHADKPFPMPLDEDKGKCTRIGKEYWYWLKCEDPRDRQSIRATIEENTIRIETVGVRGRLTVFLNPEMIDVTKEVVVELDEEEVYRGKPVPDFWTVLETLDARLDRKMVFDRRIELPE